MKKKNLFSRISIGTMGIIVASLVLAGCSKDEEIAEQHGI